MSELDHNYIIVGKTGAAYGIKGWLKIHSFTEKAADLLQYNPWYLAQSQQWQAVEVETGKIHGKGIIVKFKGIDTPEMARTLAAKPIAVKREQLAPLPPDEYYWADLIGLTIINQQGQVLGQVAYMLATGANDVVVYKDKTGREQTLPYLPGSVVQKVDLAQQVMYVDWDFL